MPPRILLRTWLGCLIGCLPLLALLLVPQLMRSRAGSEHLLLIGVTALLVLLTASFALAPLMSAASAPARGVWEVRSAWSGARDVWRRRTGAAVLALVVAIAIYAAGQAIGYALAEAVPYVHDNPAHIADATASPWLIDYPAYALQAGVLYAITALAVAVYATRIRALRLALPQAVSSAAVSPAASTR